VSSDDIRFSEHRRDFLKRTAIVAASAAVAGSVTLQHEPSAWAERLRTTGRGRVVGVENTSAMVSMLEEKPDVVQAMTDEAMLLFTGKARLAAAWQEFVSPKDIVGVKLNCLAAPGMSTSPSMVRAIVKGLQAAGIPNERIFLYEQYKDRLLDRSGFELNDDPARGPMVVHLGGREPLTDEGLLGYEAAGQTHASGESRYANLLKHCTAIINAPVIKDHNLAGVTVGMKNMTHGNINNPNDFHEHDCNPQVADIYAHPRILDKVRLVVCDGLRIQYDGGPQDSPRAKVLHNRIYVATDPVAIDAWGYKLVSELRAEKGKKPLTERHPTGSYLARAGQLGIGEHEIEKIDCQIKKLS
jgi:uncharacterized protein (DUF362 family)